MMGDARLMRRLVTACVPAESDDESEGYERKAHVLGGAASLLLVAHLREAERYPVNRDVRWLPLCFEVDGAHGVLPDDVSVYYLSPAAGRVVRGLRLAGLPAQAAPVLGNRQ